MKTQDYIRLEEEYGAHNYHPLDVVITRGEGGIRAAASTGLREHAMMFTVII